MKRKLFFAATAATLLFTGCANDEYVGEVENPRGELTEITFASKNAGITRGTSEGPTAANMLNKQFFVYGTKSVNSSDQVVFKNYMVKYTEGSTSATNLKGWEYNGVTNSDYPTEGVTPNIFTGDDGSTNYTQTPKYWDYSASSYTYYAFSAKPDDLKPESGEPKIKVKKLDKSDSETNDYEVEITNTDNIGDLYFADKLPIDKSTGTEGSENQYRGNVKLTFRPLTAKVRVGFYETIPGYDVKITNMSTSNSTQTKGEGESATTSNWDGKFIAECQNLKPENNQTIKVSYLTEGTNKNRANATVWDNDNSKAKDANNTLELGSNFKNSSTNEYTTLGKNSKDVTWDKRTEDNKGDYTAVWPQTTNNQPLKIIVDYTLTSTDGSKETIKVTGATAAVPKEYVQWMSGVAYTYLFKITDHTNGFTGETTDPAGLYPIVFDAVVEEEYQGTVTTVSPLSITASQVGTTDGYVSTEGIVFLTSKDIKLKAMYDGNDVTNSTTMTSVFVETNEYDSKKSPSQIIDEKQQSQTTTTSTQNTDPFTLSAQNNNGYWVLKFAYTTTGEPSTNVISYLVLQVGAADGSGNTTTSGSGN